MGVERIDGDGEKAEKKEKKEKKDNSEKKEKKEKKENRDSINAWVDPQDVAEAAEVGKTTEASAPTPKRDSVASEAWTSSAAAAPVSGKELEDLREENRQLKDHNMKLQTEVATVLKERESIAKELDQVKANL